MTKLLNIEDIFLIKLIEIKDTNWLNYSGIIGYKRKLYNKEYYENKSDELDEMILQSLESNFPFAKIINNSYIFFEDQMAIITRNIRGNAECQITIQFYPQLPYDQLPDFVGKTFSFFDKIFQAQLRIRDSSNVQYINNFIPCAISYDKIDKLMETITPL